jgi:redox-sensitive bicupin YhaK (pirin superfamily)
MIPSSLLMDDHLDIGEGPVGGPHPHGGFETVTLNLDGAIARFAHLSHGTDLSQDDH